MNNDTLCAFSCLVVSCLKLLLLSGRQTRSMLLGLLHLWIHDHKQGQHNLKYMYAHALVSKKNAPSYTIFGLQDMKLAWYYVVHEKRRNELSASKFTLS